jgi:hypothetical protein
MFTKWLSVESQSKLPNFGTHIVRVEAIIIRENPENPFVKEVLLIREKHGKHKDWKLISGNVELGEFVEQAVVREVKEVERWAEMKYFSYAICCWQTRITKSHFKKMK